MVGLAAAEPLRGSDIAAATRSSRVAQSLCGCPQRRPRPQTTYASSAHRRMAVSCTSWRNLFSPVFPRVFKNICVHMQLTHVICSCIWYSFGLVPSLLCSWSNTAILSGSLRGHCCLSVLSRTGLPVSRRRRQPTIQYPKNTFQRPSAWQPCLRTSPLTHICIQSIYHQRQTRRAFQSPFVAKHFPSLSCASRTLHLLDWLATPPFMPRASALTFSPCSCAIVLMDACSREA